MSEKDDRTLTGRGIRSPEPDQTLTSGRRLREPLPAQEGAHAKRVDAHGQAASTAEAENTHVPSLDLTLSSEKSHTSTSHRVTFSKGSRGERRLTQAANHEDRERLTDKVNWEVGDVIDGKFEVLELIGRGGMGVVYRVHHKEWQLEMAVKMPLTHLVSDDASKRRFIREAQTWVDLGLHLNIVQCWYVREFGGIPRVFMDYVDGGSLRDWIKEKRVRAGEWDKILDLIIQACDGLGYAHNHGVEVHRDVKPGNLLLTAKGELLVTDFGIVKRAGSEDIEVSSSAETHGHASGGVHTITATGSELGTPEYGAPEQWGEARHADCRADIYALGVILFELCCGRRPFDDGSHSEPVHVIIGRHLSSSPPDPRTFNPDVPKALSQMILTCLEKDPGNRPDSMLDLRNALTHIYRDVLGKNYRRMIPQAADLRSDALNNRAVSFLDLNREQEAFLSWNEALKLDAYHPESLYNKALLQWRAAEITDCEVVRLLTEAKHVTRRFSIYLGFIHLERGAAEQAEQEFLSALKDQEFSKNASLWRALGDSQLAQSKFLEAVRSYHNALDVGPRDFESLNRRALAHRGTREISEKRLLYRWQRCNCFFGSGHTGSILSVAISPDGRYAVSGGEDKIVRVWNPNSRECLWSLKGHDDHVLSVAITADGKSAVSGSRDKSIRLWDIEQGRALRTFRGHRGWVNIVKITPDGKRIISGSRDNTIRKWEIPTGKCFWTSDTFKHAINALAVTPDGRYALSGHDEENLYLWDLASGKRSERKFYGSSLENLGFFASTVSSLSISDDGAFAVVGTPNASVQIWDLNSGQEIKRLKGGHDEKITSVSVIPGRHLILSGSEDATLGLWDLESNEHIWTFEGHRGNVTSVATARQGQLAISAGQDSTIRVWNVMTREALWTLWGNQGHTEGVTSVAFALLGRFIVSASRDMSLRLWDVKSAKCLRTLKGHSKEVTCLAVTPDGRSALSGSRDLTLLLWDLGTGHVIRTFKGHRGPVTAVVISPDGQRAISGSADRTLRLWNLQKGKVLRIFQGHHDCITSLDVTPDGRFVVSGSRDTTIRLWNISSGKCVRTLQGHTKSVNSVKVLSDGRFVVSGSADHDLRLWHLATEKCVLVFRGHKEPVHAVAVTPDRRFVVSGGEDSTVRLWETATAKCLRTFNGHLDTVSSLIVSLNGEYIISGSTDASLRLWDLDLPEAEHYEASLQVCRQQNHEEIQLSSERFQQRMAWAKTAWENGKATAAYRYLQQARSVPSYERAPEALDLSAEIGGTLPRKTLRGEWMLWASEEDHHGPLRAIAITPDGHCMLSGSTDTTLLSWDLETGKRLQTFQGHRLAVTAAAITPDGRFVISGSKDTALCLWDIASSRCLRHYEGHEQDVTCLAVSQYGRFILSGSLDGTIRIWNPSTTECLHAFTGHKHGVTAVAALPLDKTYLVSGGSDRLLRLWDYNNGKCLQTYKGHRLQITVLALTPDGRYIVSGSDDCSLRVWRLENGECLRVLRGHEKEITDLALTPDGRFVFSASMDKSIQLWELATGQNLWALRGHKQEVTSVAISPDGRLLVSGGEDNMIRVCELDWELDINESAPPVGEDSPQHFTMMKRLTSFFQTR
ncbi:hypothetical protein CSB45_01345 [candidate division KSB3 bacterium]|uniref:Protein kinase domain-containing protein n=1 Tax=candidate division KSB3 bacterium TaxID=2044937 RepID=A0A2G6EAF9_9BACT|nr:MAG: hypothetical protein CSB45_01345 [candidate division KSB3 bacterium]PIE30759.1 MAG: hypothetical protein CSA57_02005 [candidate division KSB3 bacterium]